jgi:hypothetical protein
MAPRSSDLYSRTHLGDQRGRWIQRPLPIANLHYTAAHREASGLESDVWQSGVYSLTFESIQIVTGPSFTSATFMSAPKTPVGTFLPEAVSSSWTKRS